MDPISSKTLKLIRSRRSLLWVCQKYDLVTDQSPHDIGAPATAVEGIYRSDINVIDRTLSRLYWEAIWLEGAKSPLLGELKRVESEAGNNNNMRPLVILASESDSQAFVSSEEFLAVCVLPGLLDNNVPPDSRYGAQSKRLRERTAWSLAARLKAFPGRLIIVIGATEQRDLSQFFETIGDIGVVDTEILVVLPKGSSPPAESAEFVARVTYWIGELADFLHQITSEGAPSAREIPKWGIRLGRKVLELTPREVNPILSHFLILTENDLLPAKTFTIDDLNSFLEGKTDSWKAYTAGLPVERAYRSARGRSLFSEATEALIRSCPRAIGPQARIFDGS